MAKRLAWVTGARLLLLLGTLALLGLFYLRGESDLSAFSLRAVVSVLGASFAMAAVYASVLRWGGRLERLAQLQLVFDQLTWTAVVYLSGGASSGATSFYGLTCVVGALLIGFRGAALAAASGGLGYTLVASFLYTGWLPIPPDQQPSIYALEQGELGYYLFINLMVLVVVMLLSGYLAERLRSTGGQLVQAEQRAVQAERMAALGRLAAGLAHEIRNPLGSIAGSIQLLKTAPSLGAEDKQLCEIVEREAARLNDLVSDMMDLARPKKPQRAHTDLAVLVKEVVELAMKSGRAVSDVRVVYEGEDSLVVDADPAQLRQVIWNLVRNAVQASNAGDRVRVEVRGRQDGVELSVTDRGIGIDEEHREQLFDAFFTTRSKGTGVGLAVVKRIVDEHGFQIEVDSEKGQGACFRVRMPLAV